MKNKFFLIAGLIIAGIGLVSLHSLVIVRAPQDKFVKIKHKFELTENRIRVNFYLSKDSYLLRVRHKIGKEQEKNILFNDQKVAANTWPCIRERKNNQISYIHLPKEIVKEDKNTIDITFSNEPPPDIYIILRNYRRQSGEIYILFSDSAHLPAGENLFTAMPFTNILILLSWITAYFFGRGAFVSRDRLFLYCKRYLLLLISVLLLFFVAGWIIANLGYRVVVTPGFFWEFFVIILTPFFAIWSYKILEKSPVFFRKSVEFFLTQKEFDIRIGVSFFILIIIVNLLVYWPSLFHLFRHDEWCLFFTSKDEMPDFQFIIRHIDWQLKLPYDRLVFRPISQGMIALNRVVFDANYIGPHIVTFIKHIFATFCLWWLMWQCNRRWIAGLFALFFSVLVVSVDPVIFPHFDVYIMDAIFTILAVITFRKTIYNQLSVRKGFALTALLLFLNLLTIELGFLMPLFFFFAYWVIFRGSSETALREKDRYSWLVFLPPFVLWGTLFSVHLYFAYPNFAMTSQSTQIGLWMPFVNVGRAILTLLSGIFFPMFIRMRYLDKMYFRVLGIGVVLAILLIFSCILFGRKIFRTITKEIIFSLMLLFSVLVIFCFGRAWYVNSTLNWFGLPCSYVYLASALIFFVVYTFLDFDKIRQHSKLSFSLFIILLFLIVNHAFKTHQSSIRIQEDTAPLKTYFDLVKDFVAVHKDEPDFSFKMIDSPPYIPIFNWYHETCIDGLFNRFINNKNPKYFLEYDYTAEKLKYSIYNENPQSVTISKATANILTKPDYVNSIGIPFRKVSGQGYDFLMGMTEVTQKQWKDIMGFNPSKFQDDCRPVENVSYYMIEEFVGRLNRIENVNLYRLPAEKEYLHLVNLYATTANKQDDISKYAWLKDDAEGMTHPVGELYPMVGGFYDLIGNVWEWTGDPIYYDSEVKPFKGSPLICFGGSWRDEGSSMLDLKTTYTPAFKHEHLGFRLVRKINKDEEKQKLVNLAGSWD